jgi:hypothetical protein
VKLVSTFDTAAKRGTVAGSIPVLVLSTPYQSISRYHF